MSSNVQQVNHLFSQHRGTGQSRKAWRDEHRGFGRMAPMTFAWSSERRYKRVCCHFLKEAQERYGVHQVSAIEPYMISAYIERRRAAGLSPRTLATEVTALRRLDLYARLEGWTKRSFMPVDLTVPHGSRPRYSYTPEHAAQIIAHVAQRDPAAAEVLRWQLACGLRIDEAIRLRTDQIDYINAHGTSTPLNDSTETKAIKEVFGKHAYKLAVSSTKSMIGHTMGASGALEAIACVLTILNGIIHPTINYTTPDPECDLDYVPNKARTQTVNYALSNSFGLGGQNACLILKRFEE